MSARETLYHACVTEEGQITLPKEILNILGVTNGERITFIVEENSVRIANPAIFAMQSLQQDMAGEAEHTSLTSDNAVITLVKGLRNENSNT